MGDKAMRCSFVLPRLNSFLLECFNVSYVVYLDSWLEATSSAWLYWKWLPTFLVSRRSTYVCKNKVFQPMVRRQAWSFALILYTCILLGCALNGRLRKTCLSGCQCNFRKCCMLLMLRFKPLDPVSWIKTEKSIFELRFFNFFYSFFYFIDVQFLYTGIQHWLYYSLSRCQNLIHSSGSVDRNIVCCLIDFR